MQYAADVHADIARIRVYLQLGYLHLVAIGVEIRLQRQRAGKVFEGRHQTMQVGQRYFRRFYATCQPERRCHEVVVTETIAGFDFAQLEMCTRHTQLEVLQQAVVAPAFVSHGQTIQLEARVFAESQTFHVNVQRVFAQCLEQDVRTDIRQFQVFRVQPFRSLRGIQHVETHAGMANDKRVDAQVEWRRVGRVFRGQRVDDKLEVWLALRISLIQFGVSTEDLGR